MVGIRSVLDARARAGLERRTTGELTHPAFASRGRTVDLGTSVAAVATVLRVDLGIEAGAAARRISLTASERAVVFYAHRHTVWRRAALGAAATTVARITGEHGALVLAARLALLTGLGLGRCLVTFDE